MSESDDSQDFKTLATVLLALAIPMTCLATQLGPLLIPLILFAMVFGLFGLFHYWLWGQKLWAEEAESDPNDPRSDSLQ